MVHGTHSLVTPIPEPLREAVRGYLAAFRARTDRPGRPSTILPRVGPVVRIPPMGDDP